MGHKFKISYKMSDNGADKLLEDVFEEKDRGVFVISDIKHSRPSRCIKAVGSKDD